MREYIYNDYSLQSTQMWICATILIGFLHNQEVYFWFTYKKIKSICIYTYTCSWARDGRQGTDIVENKAPESRSSYSLWNEVPKSSRYGDMMYKSTDA